jgi:hypothetical protein
MLNACWHVQATGLREERRNLGPAAKMGTLLRGMEEQGRKSCDKDTGRWWGGPTSEGYQACLASPRELSSERAW